VCEGNQQSAGQAERARNGSGTSGDYSVVAFASTHYVEGFIGPVLGMLFHNGKHAFCGVLLKLFHFEPNDRPKWEFNEIVCITGVTLLGSSFEELSFGFPLWHAT
jgi:hypothetical protein